MKYTVVNNQSDRVNIIITDDLYLPTYTKIIALQQLDQQSNNRWIRGHILADALHLRWEYHYKLVPYHSARNLPVFPQYQEIAKHQYEYLKICITEMETILKRWHT